jgi:hypothetical protein
MDNKGISKIILVVIIVAVLAVSSIGVYLAMSGDGGGDGADVDIEGASSLSFKVSVNPVGEESVEYSYMVKNAGTSSLMMRIEMESAEEDFIYIINGAQEKVWIYSDEEWMDFSNMYPTYWETWNSAWLGYRTNLLDWTGYGDWSYTTPEGDSVRIYDIDVNPSLSDSLFQH